MTAMIAFQAQSIAIEHVLWAASIGATPAEVLLGFGLRLPSQGMADWHDVVLALTLEWQRIGSAPAP